MFGNTRLVAENIVERMKEIEGIEITVRDIEEVDLEDVANSDAIFIGGPNHWGGPTRIIIELIDNLGKTDLDAKWMAVFDTYLGWDFEKTTKKMEKRISEKIPGVTIIASGLSVKVKEMRGSIEEGELSKCKDFGMIVANQIKLLLLKFEGGSPISIFAS
jgi:flavorubredoxin